MTAPDEGYIAELVDPIQFFKQYEKEPAEVLDLDKSEIDLLYDWADLKKKIAELEDEENKLKGIFADKYGKFRNGDVTYSNVESVRKGGYDMERLKYDYPDIDIEQYRKRDSVYQRQMLKVKKSGSGDIQI
jgi:predicted phage-related endonuclease